jgi:hypothetical protein
MIATLLARRNNRKIVPSCARQRGVSMLEFTMCFPPSGRRISEFCTARSGTPFGVQNLKALVQGA